MSTLREAAKAVLDDYDGDGSIDDTERAINALRAALAQPEAEAETEAWMHSDGKVLSELAMKSLRRDFASFPEVFRQFSIPLYAHPPRDEWRLASEPPACTRSVLIWLKFGDVETFGKTLGGPSGFAFQNGAITHWRDVTPPTTEGE